MPSDHDDLTRRLGEALALHSHAALPPAIDVAALRAWLSPLGTTPALGAWERFVSKVDGDDGGANALIQRAAGWEFVSDRVGAGDYADEALQKALAAGSARACLHALNVKMILATGSQRYGDALAILREALHFLDRDPSPEDYQGLCVNFAMSLVQRQRCDLASELAAHALRVALAHNLLSALTPVLNTLSDAARMSLRHDEALRWSHLAVDAAPLSPPAHRAIAALHHASALNRVGRLDEALSFGEQAHASAVAHVDHQTTARALILLGTVHAGRGELTAALEAYHRCADLTEKTKILYCRADALSSLGACYLELDDAETALSRFRESIQVRKQMRTFAVSGPDSFYVAVCYRRVGKLDQAEKAIRRLLAVYHATNQHLLIVSAIQEMAEIHLARREDNLAQHYLAETARLAATLDESLGRAAGPTWLKLAQLHRRRKDRPAARAALMKLEAAFPQGVPGLLLPAYAVLRCWLADDQSPEEVRAFLVRQLDEMEKVRGNAPQSARRQLRGLAGAEELFDALIDSELTRGASPADVYALCQRARARRLIDLLATCEWPAPPQIAPDAIERERSLLAKLRERVADAAAPQAGYWEALDQAEADGLRAQLQKLWSDMEPAAPGYVQMRRGIVPAFSTLIAALD